MPFNENDSNNDDGNQTTGNPTQPVVDPTNQAAAPTGDDHQTVFLVANERAFPDREAVVKNIESAQSHIATLEAERKTDRDALTTAQAEIERLKKIEDSLDGRNHPGNSDQTHQMSNDEIAAQAADLAVGKIKQTATEDVQRGNLAGAEARAEAAYGKDNYKTEISKIAARLNMSMRAVDELGKSSPDAFNQLFLPAEPGQPHVPTRSSVNIPTGDGQQPEIPAANVTKMRERDRIAHVTGKMEAAGIEY